MEQQILIPHLFRTEFRKIAAVLCKYLGIQHLETAEDIASETFLSALETWPYKGVPQNPTAWLYFVAKNKAKNYLLRQQVFTGKVITELKRDEHSTEIEVDLSDKNIIDSQLQMLFAICHPALPAEAQIGLALRILCGFGIDEIANALLTNKETVNKRLTRAREKLRSENIHIAFPGEEQVKERLDNVLTTLYLLFNEGYYSETQDSVLREDLCLEAMRLAYLLIEYEPTNQPPVKALLSLMCFHASRFAARKDANGEIVLYDDQDESKWNQELISRGTLLLHEAARGKDISKYHLEGSIAYWHTIKADTPEKWENILQLFNQLLSIQYTPIAALNRTYALSKVKGKAAAIAAAKKLNLDKNPYYFTLLGELYKGIDNDQAKSSLQKALTVASSQADRQIIQKKIDLLG